MIESSKKKMDKSIRTEPKETTFVIKQINLSLK